MDGKVDKDVPVGFVFRNECQWYLQSVPDANSLTGKGKTPGDFLQRQGAQQCECARETAFDRCPQRMTDQLIRFLAPGVSFSFVALGDHEIRMILRYIIEVLCYRAAWGPS